MSNILVTTTFYELVIRNWLEKPLQVSNSDHETSAENIIVTTKVELIDEKCEFLTDEANYYQDFEKAEEDPLEEGSTIKLGISEELMGKPNVAGLKTKDILLPYPGSGNYSIVNRHFEARYTKLTGIVVKPNTFRNLAAYFCQKYKHSHGNTDQFMKKYRKVLNICAISIVAL